jgi:hypothetical protein
MEPWLRDACIVVIIILLIVTGISNAVACWQRRRDGTRYPRDD